MIVLIGLYFSLVSLGIVLWLLEPYCLLQLVVLFLLWLFLSLLIMLQLACHNIGLIVLVGVLVLIFLVDVVDVLVSVPLVTGIVGHVQLIFVHIQVVVVLVVVVYCFPPSFLCPIVLLLLLFFVVPGNNLMGPGYGCSCCC